MSSSLSVAPKRPRDRKVAEIRHPQAPPAESSPFRLAFLPAIALAALALLPRVRSDVRLAMIFCGAASVLAVFAAILGWFVKRQHRTLSLKFEPKAVHYVQMTMHSCIYAYWGWYWRDVYYHVPLILAQIVFAYGLDMLVCWSRRDKWILGFGPFPIVLSTNLFLWFKDDWFYLQFLMIAVGVLGKEFIRWKRDGRMTHIFNPSAFSLFIFSIGLLLTNSTSITWGQEISVTLHRPPDIYLEIFLIGLVVQALFSVTLVTLSAAAMLYILNLAYTHTTGVYHFIDSNIPVSVFLGLHLLVTDPATSPRTHSGKVMFGGLYGACVFGLYSMLGAFGAPQFYDKLLCVPVLNLCVKPLDWLGQRFETHFRPLAYFSNWTPRQLNWAYMAVWISLFGTMLMTGFVGSKHPGGNPEFWHQACEQGKLNACKNWARTLNVMCRANQGNACITLGDTLSTGRLLPRDAVEAGKAYGRACDGGAGDGCTKLTAFLRSSGQDVFLRDCNRGDGVSCFILGSLWHSGQIGPRDDTRALSLFEKSCQAGWARGCGRLGESYLMGEGAPPNPAKAKDVLQKACSNAFGPGCYNLAIMYARGVAGPKDEAMARRSLHDACRLGISNACEPGEEPPTLATLVDTR